MFICQAENKVNGEGQKPSKLVTKARTKAYNHERRLGYNKKVTFVTHGWEIEEELVVCKACFDKYKPVQEAAIAGVKTVEVPKVKSPVRQEQPRYRKRSNDRSIS